MKTLAIYSNKGGVGKTATTVNLSYLAARAGLKTLICDLDAQSSATYYLRVNQRQKVSLKAASGLKEISKARITKIWICCRRISRIEIWRLLFIN